MNVADYAPTPQLFPGLTRLKLLMGMQCNVRCTMCYQTDFSPNTKMEPVIYREHLKDAYPQLRTVKLLGGEPTILKNCREVSQLLRNHEKVKLIITTNGIFMDDFWHDTFIHKGELIEVSLNAATANTYSKIVVFGKFEKVIRNLERLLANRSGKTPQIHITSVILKDNVFEIADMIQLGVDMGVDQVGFITDPVLSRAAFPPYPAVREELKRAKDIQDRTGIPILGLDVFERQFKVDAVKRVWKKSKEIAKKMCPMPFDNLSIDWDGDVRVCGNTWVKVGNLYHSSLAEIWNGQVTNEFRNKLRCGDYSWCSPTCAANINPTRLSLANKVAYQLREDPKRFAKKVQQKASQVLDTLVTIKSAGA